MPINTAHPLYEANLRRWKKCRDAYEGEEAIKQAGEKYLPKVDPGQSAEEYIAYKRRALFYDAVARTADGFAGAVSRKEHVVAVPDQVRPVLSSLTLEGSGLRELVKRVVVELLLTFRCGLLVDYSEEEERAYLALYRAEDIFFWSETEIRLAETVYEPSKNDPLALVAVEQIRQLHLVEGKYTVTVWRKGDALPISTGGWAPVSETVPTHRGRAFEALPWFWVSAQGRSGAISRPPLLGLVDVVLSHYRSSADLEHGRHFAGLPTLWVSGCTAETPISVGAASAIILSEPSARAGYAEFTGQGLESLENALATKERQMAALGAAIFAEGKKGVEAAETARIRSTAETSLLASIVSAIEESIEAALKLLAEWMGALGDVDVRINRDFIDTNLDPAALLALVKAFQAGAVGLETFLFNLQQGEMLPPDMDVQQEAARLGAEIARRQANEIPGRPEAAGDATQTAGGRGS